MYRLLSLLLIIALATGCSTTRQSSYSSVPLQELSNKHDGANVTFNAHVLGMELQEHSDDLYVWIITLGDNAQPDKSLAKQLVFPDRTPKIRAVENGYNKKILFDCYKLCEEARQKGQKITVYGEFHKDEKFMYFNSGVPLHLTGIKVGDTRINTDYGDKTAVQKKAPSLLKRTYKGGKKLMDLVSGLM
jgi:hypothetical protein